MVCVRGLSVLVSFFTFSFIQGAPPADLCSLMKCPTFPEAQARLVRVYVGGDTFVDECIFEYEGKNITDFRLCNKVFQNLCDDENPIQVCDGWPCDTAVCLLHPDAHCRNRICGDCQADFFQLNAKNKWETVQCQPLA